MTDHIDEKRIGELKKKTCSICGAEKLLDDFRRDANRPDDHRAHCKLCAKNMDNKWRKKTSQEQRNAWSSDYRSRHPDRVAETMRRFRKDNPDKARAWNTLDKAVRRGSVMPQPCEACGSKNAEAHHPDYQRKFDVRWLCHEHHCLLHRAEKAEAELAKQAPLVEAVMGATPVTRNVPPYYEGKDRDAVLRAALALREEKK